MMSAFVGTIAVVIGTCFPAMALAQTLSLETYLQQVANQHQGLRGTIAASEGAALRANEADAMLAPNVFANVQQTVDEKPTANPAFQGDKSSVNTYTVGVGKQTSFGLNAKVSYGTGYYAVDGANPQFLTEPKYHDARTTIEVSQPLWRNLFGRETRALQELSRSQALATSATENFKTRMTRMEAEMTYWRLVLARESVGVNRASLQRSERIREWSANRAKLELADKSDLLQAEAAVAGRNLELRMAMDEEEAAARAFNSLRGTTSGKVNETLAAISPDLSAKLAVPTRATLRADVIAAQSYARLAAANATVAAEKYRPTFEVFGAYSLNGKDTKSGEASSQAFGTDYPTTTIGLRLNAPLGGSIGATRSGYLKEAFAAGENAKRKMFEQEHEWQDLNSKLTQTKERLKLTRSLETLQKQKLEYERDRQQRGRSTMYQVLIAEQEFANTQLNRIRTQAELLRVVAQMGTFGGDK